MGVCVRVHVHAGVLAHACEYGGQKMKSGVSLNPLCFEAASLTQPIVDIWVSLSSQELPISTSLSPSAEVPGICHHTPLFHLDAGDLNSGPHTFPAGTLPTELSPQLQP